MLDEQVNLDAQHLHQRTWLSNLVNAPLSTVLSTDDQKAAQTVADLERQAAAKEQSGDIAGLKAMGTQINVAIAADVKARDATFNAQNCSTFVADVLATIPLFMRGGKGRALSAALTGLNSVHVDDAAQDQFFDLAFGAARGAGSQLMFERMGQGKFLGSIQNPGIKNGVMGYVNRTFSTAATWDTYKDGFGTGVGRVVGQATDVPAIAGDIAIGALANRVSGGINARFDNVLKRNAVLGNMFTATVIGGASGAHGEFTQQLGKVLFNDGSFDFARVAQAGGTEALKNMLAGGAGAKLDGGRGSMFVPDPDVSPPSSRFNSEISSDAPRARSIPAHELGDYELPANSGDIGIDLAHTLMVDGRERRVTVHLPPGFNPQEPTSVYYLLDGVQTNNTAGNMPGINGWSRTADANNLVTVNLEQDYQSSLKAFGMPLPKSLFGKPIPNITSWSFDHGLLNRTRAIDDVAFFSDVHARMQQSMSVESNHIVTFSDGGALANEIAAQMPAGSIDGVANVAATTLRDTPPPKPGIMGFFVNSIHDPTIPIDGGPGPQLTKWLPKVGQRNILRSQPGLQEARFAEANGLSPNPVITDTPVYTQRDYSVSPDDEVKVRAFRLKRGGHTWPGRDTGDGTNTAFTQANGQTVSNEEFPTNDLIVRFFTRNRPIQRTLSDTTPDSSTG